MFDKVKKKHYTYSLFQCDKCKKVVAERWLTGYEKPKCPDCKCEYRFITEI